MDISTLYYAFLLRLLYDGVVWLVFRYWLNLNVVTAWFTVRCTAVILWMAFSHPLDEPIRMICLIETVCFLAIVWVDWWLRNSSTDDASPGPPYSMT